MPTAAPATAQRTFNASTAKVADRAYFKLARHESLTTEEEDALAILDPDGSKHDRSVQMRRSILDLQMIAGTGKQRAAAVEKLEELEAAAPERLDNLREKIRELQKQVDAIETEVADQRRTVKSQQDAIEGLRSNLPEFVKQEQSRRFARSHGLREEVVGLQQQVDELGVVLRCEPGPVQHNSTILRRVCRELAVPEFIQTIGEPGHPSTYQIDGERLQTAQKAATKRQAKLREELDPLIARAAETDAEVEAMRDWYIPQ